MENLFVNSSDQQVIVAPWKVRSPNAAGKKDVAPEKKIVFRRIKADASRAMARDIQDSEFEPLEFDFGGLFNKKVRCDRFSFEEKTEFLKKIGIHDKRLSFGMIRHFAAEKVLDPCRVVNVVDMAMGNQQKVGFDVHLLKPTRRSGWRVDHDISARRLN
jgi:hypothetical protein